MMRVRLTGDLVAEFEKEHKKLATGIKKEAVNRLRDATPVETGEARDGWMYDEKGIYNTVDHLRQLNRGSSQQAPLHFVERTILGIPGVKPNGIIVRED